MGNTNIFYEFLCFDFFRVSLQILLRPLRPRLTQHDRFAGFSQIRPPQAGVFQKEATSRRFHEKCVFCKESKENSRCDWCWIQWPTDDWRDIQKGRNQLHDRERVTRPHHHLRRRHVVVLLRGAPITAPTWIRPLWSSRPLSGLPALNWWMLLSSVLNSSANTVWKSFNFYQKFREINRSSLGRLLQINLIWQPW